MSNQIGPYVVGEKPPPLVYQYLDAAGLPINISDSFQAKLSVREHWAPELVALPAVVTNGAQGEVMYTWVGTEFPTPGRYYVQFWTGNGTNRYASPRFVFDVQAAVGIVPTI